MKNNAQLKYFYLLVITSIIALSSFIISNITGLVFFDGNPLPGTLITRQGSDHTDTTDVFGRFHLNLPEGSDSIMVTAWKDSFYIAGIKTSSDDDELHFILEKITHPDNPDYQWLQPDSLADPSSCIHCHDEIVTQWSANLHSSAAVDPMVLTMYNGTDMNGNKGIYPGYKLDFPNSAGSCANCHAPTAALKHGSWLTDLNRLDGVHKHGVHCDYCHKIAKVRLDSFGSRPGFLSNSLWRPYPERQLFLGSFKDSPGDDTYLSVYEKSLFCAGCHHYFNNNTPIYTSYLEWAASSYPKKSIECQDCHMKPNGITTNFAPGNGGAERKPMTIPSHNQMGEDLEDFLSQSVEMVTDTMIQDSILKVKVKIINDSTGHHFPTGNPIRNAILVVRAYDEHKNELPYLGMNKIPFWGGEGDDENDFADLPGKGFARILKDFQGISPAPQWRLTFVASDTRIPADRTDSSSYDFILPDGIKKAILDVKLIYRKSFKDLSDEKKWNLKDYIVAMDSFHITLKESIVSLPAIAPGDGNDFGLVAYPNPCSSELFIGYSLGKRTKIMIYIVSNQGFMINELLNLNMNPGDHSLTWNLYNMYGERCETGQYYLIIKSQDRIATRKIIILN
jgi:hypothetical protein